ncbi:MAG: response regulator transcription factor [Bacteroidales bacterium]|nr:response regulator transcription factor [Bacteroidales bacterium]
MKLKVAIIDNEKHAIDTLIYDLIENHSHEIEILFSTTNPPEGVKQIRITNPDLLFLDVNMPGLSGLDLADLIHDIPTHIVFTTAHQEYAAKAVETNVSGYFLKPVQTDDLQRIIKKTRTGKRKQESEKIISGKIPVSDADGIELVPWNEIIYCKSDNNYCELYLTGNRKIVASKSLKHFETNLPSFHFLRIHRSYLINFQHMKKYLKREGGELLMTNGSIVPLSRNSRNKILKHFQKNY